MKIYLRQPKNFNSATIDFYKNNFDLVDHDSYADIIVINSFDPIEAPNQIIACNSTGIEHIKAKEIISLRGEDLTDLTAVSELCLGMAIYCTRIFKGEEIRGKTLGLIGYGRIANLFADMAVMMGMKIATYDKIEEKGMNTLETVLQCDIVSLHITADEENMHFMDKEKFDLMKPGSIFLNSSRPWLVNEYDFCRALNNKLAGAWVDFPMPFAENLVFTPHLGGTTVESKAKSELIIAKKLLQKYGRTN